MSTREQLKAKFSKLPTRQLTKLEFEKFFQDFSKLPTRQLTVSNKLRKRRFISKLPTRQLTVTKLLQNQNTNTVLLISPYFTL